MEETKKNDKRRININFAHKDQTKGGRIGTLLAVISFAVVVYAIYKSFKLKGAGGFDVAMCGFISLALSLIALILSIRSFKEKDRSYIMSIIGTVLGGLVFVGITGLVIVALL